MLSIWSSLEICRLVKDQRTTGSLPLNSVGLHTKYQSPSRVVVRYSHHTSLPRAK